MSTISCGKCTVMEGSRLTKYSHKEWRNIAKRERRRRLRRKAASQREATEEQLRAALEKSAEYLKWLEQCEIEDKEKEAREKEEHDQREKLWLEEEVKAQEEWQILQEKKQKARQLQLEQEAKIRQEFETKQEAIRKKQEEEKRRREEEIKRREELLKEIDDYIDNGIKTPEALREVIDSQPGKELCPFFTKTGACRYGDTCSRNHRRVCLSKVILVPGFYTHFSLEKNSAEYDTDIALEFESSETRQHFREFYKDVVPELESFGKIKTLKYCCNTEVHLRGNLYVEYYTEREAARALRRLKGRWYAGRQLNCEFVNLRSWRSAVCGMSKCPKGRACNFLHTFKNPHDEYDIKSPPRWVKQSSSSAQEVTSNKKTEHRNKSKWEDISDVEDNKNWRWSESPEPEIGHRSRNVETRHHYFDERDFRQKSTRDKGYEQLDKNRSIDHEYSPPVKRHRTRSRKHIDEKIRDDDFSNDRDYSRRRSKKYKKRTEEDDDTSPRRSHKRHLKSSDRNYRSRSHKFSDKHSKRDKEDVEKDRYRLKSHSESCEISWERKSKGTSGKSNIEEIVDAINLPCVKSKWDKENSEQIDSESTGSSDSEVSGVVEDKDVDKSETSWKLPKKISDDEWATTDSENEIKIKEN